MTDRFKAVVSCMLTWIAGAEVFGMLVTAGNTPAEAAPVMVVFTLMGTFLHWSFAFDVSGGVSKVLAKVGVGGGSA